MHWVTVWTMRPFLSSTASSTERSVILGLFRKRSYLRTRRAITFCYGFRWSPIRNVYNPLFRKLSYLGPREQSHFATDLDSLLFKCLYNTQFVLKYSKNHLLSRDCPGVTTDSVACAIADRCSYSTMGSILTDRSSIDSPRWHSNTVLNSSTVPLNGSPSSVQLNKTFADEVRITVVSVNEPTRFNLMALPFDVDMP